MTEPTLIADTILTGESDYALAQNLIIGQAKKELLIFDQDLQRGDFSSVIRYDLLNQFLSANPQAKISMVLHSADYFSAHCPRLSNLLRIYSHKMTIMLTNEHAKLAKDCFIIADGLSYVRRVHIDQARFKFSLDDAATVSALQQRFNELLDETTYTLAATQTGL
jgi:methylmalonyl-CoA mutase N-terminal domain/subunit